MKRIPVKILLNNDGSFLDVLQDLTNTLEIVTGGTVDIECSLTGEITIYFENDKTELKNPKSIIETRPQIDMDILLRGEELKINESLSDLANSNNVSPDDGKLRKVRK